jgi:hypothetical protein
VHCLSASHQELGIIKSTVWNKSKKKTTKITGFSILEKAVKIAHQITGFSILEKAVKNCSPNNGFFHSGKSSKKSLTK